MYLFLLEKITPFPELLKTFYSKIESRIYLSKYSAGGILLIISSTTCLNSSYCLLKGKELRLA